MLKHFLVATALAVTLFAAPADAVVPDEDSAVSKNFKSFGRDLRSVRKMSDQDELVAFLEKAHAAVTANRSEVPSFMETGTPLYAEYQDGIDEFLAEIESALALAKAGDLNGAREIASGFRDFKEKYHEQFEIEDQQARISLRRSNGWDWLVRLSHWSVVVLFTLNYFFVSPDDYTHVQIGYALAAVVVVRILWGLTFARGPNRLGSFIPTPSGIRRHLHELKQRKAPDTPQHNALGAIAIWLMWFGLLAVPTLGWLFDNTDWGFDNDLDRLHKQAGELLFYLICLHITAVVLTSLWLRRNLIKAMLFGR